MAITSYQTVCGQILSGMTGGVVTTYLSDALGSATATTNAAGAILNLYRHKPYGSRQSKSGSSPDPKYQWVGLPGYRAQALSASDSYVRARHYAAMAGTWTSRDPEWPSEKAYVYSESNPTSLKDPTGRHVKFPRPCSQSVGGKSLKSCYDDLANALHRQTPQQRQQIVKDCVTGVLGVPGDLLDRLDKVLLQSKINACVYCRGAGGKFPGLPPECNIIIDQICNKWTPGSVDVAYTCPPVIPVLQNCLDAVKRAGCDCLTIFCEGDITRNVNSSECCRYVPLHELIHCVTGHPHAQNVDQIKSPDWLTTVALCLCRKLFPGENCGCLGLL